MINNYPLNLFSLLWIKVKVIDFFDIIQPVFCRTIPFFNMYMPGFVPLITEEEKAISID